MKHTITLPKFIALQREKRERRELEEIENAKISQLSMPEMEYVSCNIKIINQSILTSLYKPTSYIIKYIQYIYISRMFCTYIYTIAY